MRHQSPETAVRAVEAPNLLPFPNDLAVSPVAPPHANAPTIPESPPPRDFTLSLADITAEWGGLLKRLGRRQRILETLLAAGQPIRVTADTLIVGFPAYRRFHQELLDMSDYRSCVEEELSRIFGTRLSVVTAVYPESRGLRRHGVVDKAPA
jgi:DNA polymerase III subunit tau-like protein